VNWYKLGLIFLAVGDLDTPEVEDLGVPTTMSSINLQQK
jgi:hypothetical protein